MPTIKLPQAGKTIGTGTVRQWLKKPGDAVARGEVLVEVETDEGLVQVESPLTGKLGQILVANGMTAATHAALAVIEDAAAPSTPAAASAQPQPAGKVIPILMPKAGQSMEEGTILKWR